MESVCGWGTSNPVESIFIKTYTWFTHPLNSLQLTKVRAYFQSFSLCEIRLLCSNLYLFNFDYLSYICIWVCCYMHVCFISVADPLNLLLKMAKRKNFETQDIRICCLWISFLILDWIVYENTAYNCDRDCEYDSFGRVFGKQKRAKKLWEKL